MYKAIYSFSAYRNLVGRKFECYFKDGRVYWFKTATNLRTEYISRDFQKDMKSMGYVFVASEWSDPLTARITGRLKSWRDGICYYLIDNVSFEKRAAVGNIISKVFKPMEFGFAGEEPMYLGFCGVAGRDTYHSFVFPVVKK